MEVFDATGVFVVAEEAGDLRVQLAVKALVRRDGFLHIFPDG